MPLVARRRIVRARLRRVGVQRHEDRPERRAGQVPLDRREFATGEPGSERVLQPAGSAGGGDQRFRTGRLGRLDHPGEHLIGRPSGDLLRRWPVRAGQVPAVLPHVEQGEVQSQ